MPNATKYLERLRVPSVMSRTGLWAGGVTKIMRFVCPRFSALVGFVLAFTGCGGGGSTTAPVLPQTLSLSSVVDPLASSAMKQQGIPGMTVALAKNGTMLYAKAYGDSDIATQSAAETSTIFEIGSITKQFTAALIMKLQEQGELHVDDSISAYLPDYKFPSAITLRMLLTHTSGLANYTTFTQYPSWAINGVSEATVLSSVSQAPLLFPPGTQWSYSNSNYFLLGVIIEKLSGQSYAANLEQYIFQPLNLTNTYFSVPPPAQSAIGYTLNQTSVIPALVCDRSTAFAAGALSSNVSDLIVWDNALINGKVVSPASFTAMTTPVSSSIPGGGSYGFGLFLRPFDNHPTIWHSGGINGFTAENNVFLDSGLAVVVLANSDAADPDTIATEIMGAVCTSTQFSSNC
jgi:D-alanyl-D-alanine carboxypeptidase